MAAPNDLVYYHYNGSPFAKRVVWYLALRGINYAECLQPMIMPRPDLEALNVKYRRIPLLAHGRHVYCDTRAILSHLDAAFPAPASHPSIAPSTPFEQAYATLLDKWVIEAGIFGAASALLPPDLPALKDPKFQQDRQQMTGRSWTRADMIRSRPAATQVVRDAFITVEEQVLGDGRDWVLGGSKPSIADIALVWPFWWLAGIPGALEKEVISPALFPKVYAWIKRFDAAAKEAGKKAPKPARLKGAEAAKVVLGCDSQPAEFRFDDKDPSGLKRGDEVLGYPTDSGVANRDRGKLVGLDVKEAVLETKAPGGETVYIHHPRTGFRVVKAEGKGAKL